MFIDIHTRTSADVCDAGWSSGGSRRSQFGIGVSLTQPLACTKQCTQQGGASPSRISSSSGLKSIGPSTITRPFRRTSRLRMGPSIYAVNDHYIKPVTAAAGKMSWALMMNPDDLTAICLLLMLGRKMCLSSPIKCCHPGLGVHAMLGAVCLQITEFRHWHFASVPINVSFCTCTAELQVHVGGAQPAQECLYKVCGVAMKPT